MNILHLVLGCKNSYYTPIENAAKQTWLKNPPENIKTIFIYGESDKIYWDGEQSFYVNRPENHHYNICLYKTITAFEWFIESEFDYVYRTNNLLKVNPLRIFIAVILRCMKDLPILQQHLILE